MIFHILKIIISALLIWTITFVSKKFSFWGAVLASVPLITVISFIWIYLETQDTKKIAELSYKIFWLVIPSLVLFIVLPLLLKYKVNFPLALFLSIGATTASYLLMIYILSYCGIKL